MGRSVIDRTLDQLEQDVQGLTSTVARVVELVDDGGDEYPGELTVGQAQRFAALLGAVGVIGAKVLERDARRTFEREDAKVRR